MFAGAQSGLADATNFRPNVIFIMTDDQGSLDLGCYGAKDLHTPAADRLAAAGVRFTRFYAAAPVCSPSRAAMLTGRYPARNGLVGNAPSQPGEMGGLRPEEKTMADMFKAAGYSTAHVGKWHLGYSKEMRPESRGFDYSFGHLGGCIDNYSHFFYWGGPNIHDLYRNGAEVFHPGEYFPDLMVREAAQFIERHREQPFFLHFAMNTPHYPYQGESKWIERFKDLPYPRNLYAAFVASQDERIGALMQTLDRLELRKKTIVVFQSDNGHSTEERAHFGGGSAGESRGAKFSLFEGGIRVPAIISWPGRLPAGETRAQAVHSCDWLPTLASLCSVPLLNRDVDGKDIASVIQSAGADEPHKALHWHWGRGANTAWAVREGDWKLIVSTTDSANGREPRNTIPMFLANLAADPGERKDFSATHPEVVTRLKKVHDQWLAGMAGAAQTRD